MKKPRGTVSLLAIGILGAMAFVPPTVSAHTLDFEVDFIALNNSGVTGSATLNYDEHSEMLRVTINAAALEPNQMHPAHIHGLPGGANSTIPTLINDLDRDGFIEVVEGGAKYGPIRLNITSPPGGEAHPVANASGVLNFSQVYNLDDPTTFANIPPPPLGLNEGKSGLFPLENRHVVLHGLSVLDGHGAGTGGEVDGTAGYKLLLPVANGEIFFTGFSDESIGGGLSGTLAPIPEPGSLVLLSTGIGWLARRLKRAQS